MRDLRRIFPLGILPYVTLLPTLLRGSLGIIPLAVEILLLAQMITFFYLPYEPLVAAHLRHRLEIRATIYVKQLG